MQPKTNGYQNGHGPGFSALQVVSKLEPSRGPSHEYWWNLTAPQLALMLKEAGYPPEKQLETLLFYYHWVVPYLGPKPEADGSLKWPSLVSAAGVPLEYSWKWDTETKGPDVRLTIEAINELSGTQFDPLNQSPSLELLQRLSAILPDLNQAWMSHFLSSLYDHDKIKYIKESQSEGGMPLRSTMLLCFEFGRKSTSTKTYFSPRKLGQQGFAPLKEYMSAIQGLGPSRALNAVTDFLDTSPEGAHLKPFMLAVDNIDPSSSRLKFYFASPSTSYASIREVLTLGGRIASPGLEDNLRTLHDLVKAIMPVPENLPDDADIPVPTPGPTDQSPPSQLENGGNADMAAERAFFVSGYQYYFDIAPGATLPDIKFYVPIRNGQMDDRAVAEGLTRWMRERGRGRYCDAYIRVLEGLAQGRDLGECRGLHTHVCAMIRADGEFDITSYLAPGVSQ
ncbi:aromatic prenyltransferase [Aspergillus lucknowensis]|uniref:Aromatic prenyltransferase n=1 Tax=Aspergillus lucknowensis TaxID=176173 RepID=A0ABR4LEJ4_9EURO